MTRELRFTVVGLPAPKGSGRAFTRRRKDGRIGVGIDHDNPRTKGWQQNIANVAAIELQRRENAGLRFEQGPIEIECWFYLPRPKALLTKSKAPIDHPHTKKPDADKLLRSAKDALSGVVWTDDAQVTDAIARKRYCRAGEFPRAVITIRHANPCAGSLLD